VHLACVVLWVCGAQEQLAQAEARGAEALQAAEAEWERQRGELVSRHAAEAEGLRTQLRAAVEERAEAVARSQRRLADLQVRRIKLTTELLLCYFTKAIFGRSGGWRTPGAGQQRGRPTGYTRAGQQRGRPLLWYAIFAAGTLYGPAESCPLAPPGRGPRGGSPPVKRQSQALARGRWRTKQYGPAPRGKDCLDCPLDIAYQVRYIRQGLPGLPTGYSVPGTLF
jgi:hypothetical protein